MPAYLAKPEEETVNDELRAELAAIMFGAAR